MTSKQELEALDEAIAGVREALAEFDSEDVVVMARRAAEEIEQLTRERDEAQMAASVAGTETGAYWKGHDEALWVGVAERWQQALEAPIPAPGAMNEPLESLYRRTERLRAALEEIRDLDVAYKDIHDARGMACEALGITDESKL